MKKRTIGVMLAGAAAILAVVWLFSVAGGQRSPAVNLDSYEVLGAVTAEETAKLLGNKGQVVVIARESAGNPSIEAEVRTLQQTLKKIGIVLERAERIKMTPMMMMSTGGGMPAEDFVRIVKAHPQAGAVVLFFGFPPLADEEVTALKHSGVKFVVVSGCRPGYRRLLERAAIDLAIVPRWDAAQPAAQTARTLRARFDQEYVALTPAQAGQVPY